MDWADESSSHRDCIGHGRSGTLIQWVRASTTEQRMVVRARVVLAAGTRDGGHCAGVGPPPGDRESVAAPVCNAGVGGTGRCPATRSDAALRCHQRTTNSQATGRRAAVGSCHVDGDVAGDRVGGFSPDEVWLKATRPAADLHVKNLRNRLSPARNFRLRPPRMPPGIRASISMPSVM